MVLCCYLKCLFTCEEIRIDVTVLKSDFFFFSCSVLLADPQIVEITRGNTHTGLEEMVFKF